MHSSLRLVLSHALILIALPSFGQTTQQPASPSIGLNFRRSVDDVAFTSWPSSERNGYLAQRNWNQVVTAGNQSVADPSRIQTPVPEQVVDASGQATTLTFSSEFAFASWSTNSQTLTERLFGGYLLNRGNSVGFEANQVPYSNYDIYVYVSGPSNLGLNTVHLNRDSAEAKSRTVRPRETLKAEGFFLDRRVPEGVRPHANIVVFRNLTDPSFTIHIDDDFAGSGLAALQIIDRNADTDGDDIPDWWELLHATDAATANADDDLDGDLLSNLGEFNRQSDPRNPDTDNDQLSDLVETNTGVYVDLNNTGTDPNYADSDDDRLSDYDELYDINPSNPNLSDTDDDGIDDRTEHINDFSPTDSTRSDVPIPQVSNANEVLWEVNGVLVQWDHTVSPPDDKWLFHASLENTSIRVFQNVYNPQIRFGLRFIDGKLVRNIRVNTNDTWKQDERSFGIDDLGTTDLSAACGFSGRGANDFSDPLNFRLHATKNSDDTWNLTFAVVNTRTGADVFRYVDPDATASANINAGTASWRVMDELDEFGTFEHHETTTVFLTGAALDRTPIFSEIADLNDDGIPDFWASQNTITTSEADDDNDGLSNYQEFLAGTNPQLPDSDNDGVSDAVEFASFTAGAGIQIQPPFALRSPPANGDFNQNGLPDLWEAFYTNGGTLNASADPDGDGFSNLEESQAGTDPFDASSFLELTAESQPNGLKLSWSTHPDKIFSLQESETLLSFDPVTSAAPGIVMPTDEITHFFRIVADDRDQDQDGLSDAEERLFESDPQNANSLGASVLQDLNQDGTAERTLSGDYARLAERYLNRPTTESSPLPAAGELTPREASRFLMQATYGPTMKEINNLRMMGIEAWVDDQIHAQPMSSYRAIIEEFVNDINGPRSHTGLFITPARNFNPTFLEPSNINTAFAESAIKGPDQLRQRAAFALTQFFVISRVGTNGVANPLLVSQYYDLLAENAFGNFYDLLKKITRNYSMGVYLSSINNQKADPSINRFPDENYAREVMQLFTIGIHELNNDGSLKRNAEGRLIETYDTADVTEMARVMTGLRRANQGNDDPFGTGSLYLPMVMEPERHDFGEKQILKRHTIPARAETQANGELDIDDALLVLFNHENTPPFVSRSFIQFLVTDNPSPAYIERVANSFIDDGNGVRGNMEALFKAILFDPEARNIAVADSREDFGRLRDPLVRIMHLARILRMARHDTVYWWSVGGQFIDRTGQEMFASPTVFNFYNPDHRPSGPLFEKQLVGAPFEILDSITAVTMPNRLWEIISDGFQQPPRINQDGYSLSPSYEEFLPYADNNEALVDLIDLLLCAGRMKLATRQLILEALSSPRFTNQQRLEEKVQLALYLTAISPEGAITR